MDRIYNKITWHSTPMSPKIQAAGDNPPIATYSAWHQGLCEGRRKPQGGIWWIWEHQTPEEPAGIHEKAQWASWRQQLLRGRVSALQRWVAEGDWREGLRGWKRQHLGTSQRDRPGLPGQGHVKKTCWEGVRMSRVRRTGRRKPEALGRSRREGQRQEIPPQFRTLPQKYKSMKREKLS